MEQDKKWACSSYNRRSSCSSSEFVARAVPAVMAMQFNKFDKAHKGCAEKDVMNVVFTSDIGLLTKKRAQLAKEQGKIREKELRDAELERKREEEEDRRSALVCTKCGLLKSRRCLLVLDACGHYFCKECLAVFILSKLDSGTCLGMNCLMQGCNIPLRQNDLKGLLVPEEFERYLVISFEEFVQANGEFTRCPNVTCNNVVQVIEAPPYESMTPQVDSEGRVLTRKTQEHREKYRFRCNICRTEFCTRCKSVPYHLGWTCKQFTKWQNSDRCRFCNTMLRERECLVGEEEVVWDGKNEQSSLHCLSEECVEKGKLSCLRMLSCGHRCCGIRDEIKCLPCLEPKCGSSLQTTIDFCSICYIEPLGCAPCIRLSCGHVFHFNCVKEKIESGWSGSRITFGYLDCAICKRRMEHPALTALLSPALDIYEQVVEKALQRLRFLALERCDDLTLEASPFFGQPENYALHRFSFYQCYRCKKPYFGGDKVLCGVEENIREFDEAELVCGKCVNMTGETSECPDHGKDFIEYKCRYCCDIAVWFCWGTTHFCDACHKNAANLLTARKQDLPSCQCSYQHAPNGEEFSFCLLCRLELHRRNE